jgi:tRNA pseudouridine38-40 synthase
MRYFAQISYNGKNYNGWQIQKNSVQTIQAFIQEALFTISRIITPIVGCGRTDTGVHALDYFIHFDSPFSWEGMEYKLNRVLPIDIVIYQIRKVEKDSHARFDAISRTYQYKLHTYKNAFNSDKSFYYLFGNLDLNKLNEVCSMINQYEEFFPFCKSKSGVEHYKCKLGYALCKQISSSEYRFEIKANRFLRGMVRLIVGACLLVNEDKLTVNQIEDALINQSRLPRNLSVPPQGLYLTEITYPEGISSLFSEVPQKFLSGF